MIICCDIWTVKSSHPTAERILLNICHILVWHCWLTNWYLQLCVTENQTIFIDPPVLDPNDRDLMCNSRKVKKINLLSFKLHPWFSFWMTMYTDLQERKGKYIIRLEARINHVMLIATLHSTPFKFSLETVLSILSVSESGVMNIAMYIPINNCHSILTQVKQLNILFLYIVLTLFSPWSRT